MTDFQTAVSALAGALTIICGLFASAMKSHARRIDRLERGLTETQRSLRESNAEVSNLKLLVERVCNGYRVIHSRLTGWGDQVLRGVPISDEQAVEMKSFPTLDKVLKDPVHDADSR